MKSFIFLCFHVFFCISIFGQTQQVKRNKLLNEIANSEIDSIKINKYYEISDIYIRSEFKKADSISNIIFELSKKSNFEKGFGYYHFNIGKTLFSRGNLKLALSHFFKAKYYFKKLKNKSLYLESIYNISFCYMINNQSDKGKDLVAFTLGQYKKSSYIKELSYLNLYMGVYYYELKKNNLEKSLNYLFNSCYYAKKSNFTSGVINCYSQIVLIYFQQKKWDKARYYASDSQKYLKIIEKKTGVYNELYNATFIGFLSKSNYFLNEYSTSLAQAKKSLRLSEKLKNDELIFLDLNLIALNNYALGNYKIAIYYANIVKKRFPDATFFEHHIIGNCHYKLHNYTISNFFLKSALKNNQKLQGLDELIDSNSIYKDLSNVCLALDDYKSAYFYNEKFYKNKIELLRIENNSKTSEIAERFHSKNLEIDNNRLIQTEKKKELELQIERNNIYFTFIFLILLSLLLCIVLIFYFKIVKTNKTLNSQKHDLEISKNQKEVLLREIHHRVKNNLQLITSMQNIQARKSNDKSIFEFLEKGHARIASMSLIHQYLYLNENEENIDIGSYLSELVAIIQDSFPEKEVEFKLASDKIEFSIEISMSIGLIINELVSNSYKHAFPNENKGTISIQIERVSLQNFKLVYWDSGVPFVHKINDCKQFGLDLVQLLVSHIKGDINFPSHQKKEIIVNFKQLNF
jgi:two-component sensor histidine kinase